MIQLKQPHLDSSLLGDRGILCNLRTCVIYEFRHCLLLNIKRVDGVHVSRLIVNKQRLHTNS
jgi:hypothetical protein